VCKVSGRGLGHVALNCYHNRLFLKPVNLQQSASGHKRATGSSGPVGWVSNGSGACKGVVPLRRERFFNFQVKNAAL